MTLQDVIDAYKAINTGNTRTDAQFAKMVTALDRTVQEKMLHTFPYVVSKNADTGEIIRTAGTLIEYTYPDDANKELLLSGTPYDDLYGLYIPAMVSFEQEDWMKYQNKKNMYNARYMEALAYFNRNNERVQENKFRNYW